MRARQLSRGLHLLPTNGTIVRVLRKVVLRSQRIRFLHVIKHPQIVAVFLELSLDLVHEISQLHDYDEAGHRQEDVAPEQHVQMVQEINCERSYLKDQLNVVRDVCPLIPGYRLVVDASMTHVVQEDPVSGQYVACTNA